MYWSLLLLILGVALLAVFLSLSATRWTKTSKTSTREIYVPFEVVREVEKIIRVSDETLATSKEIQDETPKDVSQQTELEPLASPSIPLFIEQVLFIGTPSATLKAWVKTLPLASDTEILRLNLNDNESDQSYQELYYHLMAMTRFSKDCMLVVDSGFQPDDQIKVHVEHGPMHVISKKPPVYLIWHYQAKDWSDRLLKRYRSKLWDHIFDDHDPQ